MKNNGRLKVGIALLLAVLIVTAALIWGHMSAPSRTEAPLVVAYGDDIAGVLIRKALEDIPAKQADVGLDAISMGDCCGSNAQFALSTGQVDVAILCPDAFYDLEETGKQYTVVGEMVYDGNVLVTRPDSPEELQVIGYMSGRDEQRALLERLYGTRTELQPMFSSALPYALENRAVDAIMLDASLALKLDYPVEPVSCGEVTSVMIVRSELLSDPRLQQLIEAYNSLVASLADEEILVDMLCEYLETENSEEVSAFWKTVTVRFGSL